MFCDLRVLGVVAFVSRFTNYQKEELATLLYEEQSIFKVAFKVCKHTLQVQALPDIDNHFEEIRVKRLEA